MDLERHALYNSLRMNWLRDPTLSVEPWQVENYRALPLEILFERLNLQDIALDKTSFLSVAEEFDTPEEMTDSLLENLLADPMAQDQVYLVIFELWRRLVPEKLCLSIFCDELDEQIFRYDTGQLENLEAIEDVLANLGVILDENADNGSDPLDVFETICSGCANDVETFLYDFIAEQVEERNDLYASELLDKFSDYVKEVKWFDFLRTKLAGYTDPEGANLLIQQLVQDASAEADLEFNLELLSLLVQTGNKKDFTALVKKTVPLLECEEDFQDLLTICGDFYHRLDQDNIEIAIQKIIQKRTQKLFEEPINVKDPDIAALLYTMNL